MDAAVLVLNAEMGPMQPLSLKHAVRMLFREVAEVLVAELDK